MKMNQCLDSQHLQAVINVKNYLGLKAAELFSLLLQQKPAPADSIVFLQGDRFDRADKVQSLFNNALARLIFITGNNILAGRGKRYEENDVRLSKLKERLINKGIPEEAIIIDEHSLNTYDQATNTIKTAKNGKWSTMLVVTSPYHTLRAYLTFVQQIMEQGWDGKIIMQCAHKDWNRQPSGRKRTAIEMLKVEMEKIKKYKSGMATMKQGKKYFNDN